MRLFLLITMLLMAFISKDIIREKVFEVNLKDSLSLDIEMVFDNHNLPDLYYSYVVSPVCDDGLCKMVYIQMYWDLLGNFHHFEVPDGQPLTKFDHVEFTRSDYLKLEDILSDKASVLGKNKVEDLIDQKTKMVSNTVDATTGATRETVKKSVVSGAVYSSYTLWHIVNGEIADKIIRFTNELITPELLRKLIESDNYHYHHYVLDEISDSESPIFQDGLIRLVGKGNVFVAQRTLEKIPDAILEDEKWQYGLVHQYPNLIYQKQQMILDRFKLIKLHTETLNELTAIIPGQSESQMKEILILLDQNSDNADDVTITNIARLLESTNPAFVEAALSTLNLFRRNNKLARKTIKDYEKEY